MKEWSGGGAPAGSPMLKLASFLLKEKNSTIDAVMIVYLLWLNGSVFVSGYFPC